jgi:hypothetical protein
MGKLRTTWHIQLLKIRSEDRAGRKAKKERLCGPTLEALDNADLTPNIFMIFLIFSHLCLSHLGSSFASGLHFDILHAVCSTDLVHLNVIILVRCNE